MLRISTPSARARREAAPVRRLLTVALLALCAMVPLPEVQAIEMTSLYTVEVPLDPTDPDARDNAYRTALTQVLIRVTGTTAAAESAELAEVFPDAARFVLQYRQGPDNTLIVSLDGASIERALRQFGATVWDSNRPMTLVLLGVDWGQGDREIIMADDDERSSMDMRSVDRNRELRERVQAVAELRGLPVVFPMPDRQEQERLSFTDIWGGFDEQVMAAAAPYGASSVLVGRIRPDSMLEQRWTWYHNDQRRDWSGSPEQALNLLGDALAAQYAVGGDTAVETVRLTISGVNSVNAYGEMQRLMNNLRGIDRFAVKMASGDRITYEVSVQGGVERLGRALEQSGLLVRVDPGGAIDGSPLSRGSDPFADDDIWYGEPDVLEYRYRSD